MYIRVYICIEMYGQAYQYSVRIKITSNNIIVLVTKIQYISIHDDYVNNFAMPLYSVSSQKYGFSQSTMELLKAL